jgi:hypothetical protein
LPPSRAFLIWRSKSDSNKRSCTIRYFAYLQFELSGISGQLPPGAVRCHRQYVGNPDTLLFHPVLRVISPASTRFCALSRKRMRPLACP